MKLLMPFFGLTPIIIFLVLISGCKEQKINKNKMTKDYTWNVTGDTRNAQQESMGEKELIISSGIIGDSKVYLKQFFYNIIWVKITPEIEIKDSTYKAFVNSYPYMKAEEMNKGLIDEFSDYKFTQNINNALFYILGANEKGLKYTICTYNNYSSAKNKFYFYQLHADIVFKLFKNNKVIKEYKFINQPLPQFARKTFTRDVESDGLNVRGDVGTDAYNL